MKIKNRLICLCLVAATCPAIAQTPPNATTTANVVAESSVQYATNGSGFTSFTNYITGYNKVKYSTITPCKSYFKFDFTGQNVNTNYLVKFSVPYVAQNGQQHMQLWILNQSYPGFVPNGTNADPAAAIPSLTWTNAQANDTNITANGLLTSGAKTATLVNDFTSAGGSTGNLGFSLPAPWGQYLINNQIVIALGTTNDAGNNSNGGRLQLNAMTAAFQPLTASTLPPSISTFPNLTVKSTQSSGNIPFTVSDPQDAAATLTNITVSLGNTNITLTVTNITSGSGGSRNLQFIPVSNLAAGQTATATATVTVTDSAGNSATTSFLLTVTPFISLPIVLSGTNVNYLPPTNRIGIGSLTIPFQIVDTNVAASSLVVTGAVSAYSTNISAISFASTTGIAPNTNNCTLTLTANGSGVGIVNVIVIDPVNSVTNTVPIAVMVLPDSSYAACDNMNYQPSTSYSSSSGHADLAPTSANLWAPRSTAGSVNMITTLTPSSGGVVPIGVPLVRGTSSGNQNQLRLAGSPYTAGSHKVLFASVNAQWFDASLYGANAAYPGTSTGGFVEFAADSSATGVAMAAVCTVSNVANTVSTDGTFFLGLYNGTNTPSVNNSFSQTIPNFNASGALPNPVANIVVSYDVDTGISSMWINQTNSTGTSVTLQDVATTNLVNANYLVLRQNANMGDIIVNNVAVKVVTKPVPTITGITKSGNNIVISFTSAPGSGGSASVQGSSAVNGTYNTLGSVTINESPANSGNFTASFTASGNQNFYRIVQTGGTPTVNFPF
jgi:hypothetical protein